MASGGPWAERAGGGGEGEAACVPHPTSSLHPCAASCSWEEPHILRPQLCSPPSALRVEVQEGAMGEERGHAWADVGGGESFRRCQEVVTGKEPRFQSQA